MKQQTEAIAKSKGLDSKIKFYGFQKNAMKYMRDADVLVLPSIIEGLPGVILEAFYCKIPVVAFDVGGIKEIVINNETGRLIQKGNNRAFAEGVLDATLKSVQNQKLIDNAHQLVIADYLNTQIAKRFITVYESLAP